MNSIPKDVQKLILGKLDYVTLCRLRCVCSQWNAMIGNSILLMNSFQMIHPFILFQYKDKRISITFTDYLHHLYPNLRKNTKSKHYISPGIDVTIIKVRHKPTARLMHIFRMKLVNELLLAYEKINGCKFVYDYNSYYTKDTKPCSYIPDSRMTIFEPEIFEIRHHIDLLEGPCMEGNEGSRRIIGDTHYNHIFTDPVHGAVRCSVQATHLFGKWLTKIITSNKTKDELTYFTHEGKTTSYAWHSGTTIVNDVLQYGIDNKIDWTTHITQDSSRMIY